MGIKTEYNPDLALRNLSCHLSGERKIEECIPEPLVVGETYNFLKDGQRHFWLEGNIPLLETQGNEILSRPYASVRILEATHFMIDNKVKTRGIYRVVKVYDPKDPEIHFESYAEVNSRNSHPSESITFRELGFGDRFSIKHGGHGREYEKIANNQFGNAKLCETPDNILINMLDHEQVFRVVE